MRKIFILVMLALLLGVGTTAQAEVSYNQIIQNLLSAQNITGVTNAQIDASLATYETYGAGTYTVHGYGKQAGLDQVAKAYSPSGAFADVDVYANSADSTGELITPVVSFTTLGEWGFKGANTSGGFFFSEKSKNSDSQVHWKLFCLKSLGYDIGFAAFEDGTDFDYNDLVLKITPNPTPIPGSLLLLGSGLIGVIGLRRKFNV